MAVTVGTGITAFAGGGLVGAIPLTKQYNNVTVVATEGDSVVLPAVIVGNPIIVENSGAFALAIFPPSVSIDDGDVSDAVLLQPGHIATFTPINSTSYKSDNAASQSVTQITTISTGVSISGIKGVITTVTATNAASAAATFTVTNPFAQANSNVHAYIVDYSGAHATNGSPVVSVKNRTNGTFDIVIVNTNPSNALNGVLKIGFRIEN